MFPLLHQYLINHSSLALPGIGILQFADTSAQPLADGHIVPPKREIKLVNDDVTGATPQLMGFLSKQLDMTETQAQLLFQQFLQVVSSTLAEKQLVAWDNLGEFKKDNAGNIRFTQTADLNMYHLPVEARRINHHNTDKYNILVGDNETNNLAIQQEQEMANHKKSHWWIWAIVIAVVAAVAIVFRFW